MAGPAVHLTWVQRCACVTPVEDHRKQWSQHLLDTLNLIYLLKFAPKKFPSFWIWIFMLGSTNIWRLNKSWPNGYSTVTLYPLLFWLFEEIVRMLGNRSKKVYGHINKAEVSVFPGVKEAFVKLKYLKIYYKPYNPTNFTPKNQQRFVWLTRPPA